MSKDSRFGKKHDMRHLSCRLNICKHPPTTKPKGRFGLGVQHRAMRSSMTNIRDPRENIECKECGSWDARVGRFMTKCYNCGLEIEHD